MSLRNVVARITGRGCRDGRRGGRGDGGLADVRIAYTPDDDGLPDPGEVVWTWVPYEDDPNQGKDRPVVVIGSVASDGEQLAVVPVTSRSPEGRPGAWVSIGSGRWDGKGRTSYANVDRVLRVPAGDVRREGATLARDRFDAVIAGVRRH